jgi:hypothetical protein
LLLLLPEVPALAKPVLDGEAIDRNILKFVAQAEPVLPKPVLILGILKMLEILNRGQHLI